MKKNFQQLKLTVFLSIFVATLVVSVLTPLISPKIAYAESAGWTALRSQAAGWSWVSALGGCLTGGKTYNLNENITKGGSSLNGESGIDYDDLGNQITTGYPMFRNNPQIGNIDRIDIGHVIPDGDNSDGVILCTNVADGAMHALGYSSIPDFLKDLGYTDSGAYWKPVSVSTMDANLWAIANRKGINKDPAQNDSIKYMFYYYAYLGGACKGNVSATENIGKTVNIIGENDTEITKYYAKVSDLGRDTIVLPHRGTDTCANALAGMQATASAATSGLKSAQMDYANQALEKAISVYVADLGEKFCSGRGPSAGETCTNEMRQPLIQCFADQGLSKDKAGMTVDNVNGVNLSKLADCLSGKINKPVDEISAVLQSASLDAQTTPPSSNDGSGSGDECLLEDSTVMRWMACGVLFAAGGVLDLLYNTVGKMLATPVDTVFSENFKNAADSFRNIGMALIVIAGLVMIIATATGTEIVDAYTLRKILPKLGVALVGMALSWPLLKFAVSITNDLGMLAGNFVSNLSGDLGHGSGANVVGGVILGVFGAIGATAAAIGSFFIFGWASVTFILAGVLAVLIGLLTLAIRQILLVTLILFAPLAIAAYVLPGTEKLWKLWKNIFIATLMAFPIIMVFLKSGEFFAKIVVNTFGDIGVLLALLVFFAPYFMLPLAFKMSGGLLGQIFGMINDREKGLFDRMRNMRGNAMKKNVARMQDGTRFRDRGGTVGKDGKVRSGLSQKLNYGLQAATNLDKIDAFGGSYKNQFDAFRLSQQHRKAQEALKNNPHLSHFAQDDNVLNVASETAGYSDINAVTQALLDSGDSRFDNTSEQGRAEARRVASLIHNAKTTMGEQEFRKAIFNAKTTTGTAWNRENSKGETYTDYAAAAAELKAAYGDDLVGRQSGIAVLRSGLSGSGHTVGGASFGAWVNAMNSVNAGATPDQVNKRLHKAVAKELQPGAGAQGKTYAVRENAIAHAERIEEMVQSWKDGKDFVDGYTADGREKTTKVDFDMIQREFAKAQVSLQTASSAGGEAGDIYSKILQGHQLSFDYTEPDGTVHDFTGSIHDIAEKMEKTGPTYQTEIYTEPSTGARGVRTKTDPATAKPIVIKEAPFRAYHERIKTYADMQKADAAAAASAGAPGGGGGSGTSGGTP